MLAVTAVKMRYVMNVMKKNSTKNSKGTSGRVKEAKSPIEKAHRTCCHGKQDLVARRDLWWCAPDYLGSETWFKRVHACFGCQRAFVQVGARNLVPIIPKDFKKLPPVSKYHESVQAEYEKHNHLLGKNNLTAAIDGGN